MISAADTNVLLDVLVPGSAHAGTSQSLLDDALDAGSVIICEPVYAELGVQFSSPSELSEFLLKTRIRLVSSSPASLQRAAEAWRAFAKRRRREPRCQACGRAGAPVCSACGRAFPGRPHVLADFLIGGHAVRQADRLLTRDRGYYRAYFPELGLLSTGSSLLR